MVNTGIELQLNSRILEATDPRQFGLDLGFNISYNHNKVTKVDHLPATGLEALSSSTLNKGYPVNSLFSYDFAGLVKDGDMQYFHGKTIRAMCRPQISTPTSLLLKMSSSAVRSTPKSWEA